jgi:hypothetical protein
MPIERDKYLIFNYLKGDVYTVFNQDSESIKSEFSSYKSIYPSRNQYQVQQNRVALWTDVKRALFNN